jgi:hypothetical protein
MNQCGTGLYTRDIRLYEPSRAPLEGDGPDGEGI